MADIELVIKIPEETVNEIKDNAMFTVSIPSDIRWDVTSAIVNGTVLPKGHGDLIDRNELLKHYDSTTYHNGIEERKIHFVQIGYVNDAPTIIEADKEESGEE